MYYLVEDPTYLLAALGLAAVSCLVAVRVTQQGKYLMIAGIVATVAAALFAFEKFWITDAERIEAVVYDLARAIEASDAARVESHIDAGATVGRADRMIDGLIPIRIFLAELRRVRFDFVRVSHLTAEAGAQTRRGSAEFKVMASGTVDEGGVGDLNFGAVASEWSLGFREASPGVWKVTRVTPINLPSYALPILQKGGGGGGGRGKGRR